MSSAGLEMALWVSDRQGLVIPAYINKNLEKMPLIREWQNKGSRDVEVIRGWYDERPWANCGILGGRGSWLVFDCDGADAVAEFRSLCNNHSGIDWSKALVYRTPGRKEVDGTGGGLHCMWRWPDAWMADLHKCEYREEGWRGGLELRGRSTWTLLPCSRRDGEYEIINAPEGQLDVAPRELIVEFMAKAQQTTIGTASGDLREVSPEDAWAVMWTENRKQCLAGLSWHQAIRGMGEEELLDLCNKWSEQCCNPPLDLAIIERKVRYTWQRANAARERVAAEAASYSKWMKL